MDEMLKLQQRQEYWIVDPEIDKHVNAVRKKIKKFNLLDDDDPERNIIIREILGSVKKSFFIQNGFKCDFGYNIHLGEQCFINYDCIFMDDAPINIGDNCMFAPRVCLCTPGHPFDAPGRRAMLGNCAPINIGNDVWIGCNVTVKGGVTIGNNVIIGAGSVVVKNIQDNVIVAGNPAKIIRKLDPNSQNQDRTYYLNKTEEYINNL